MEVSIFNSKALDEPRDICRGLHCAISAFATLRSALVPQPHPAAQQSPETQGAKAAVAIPAY